VRAARAEDAWRRAGAHDRGFRIIRLDSEGISPLGALDAAVPNGLLVVCGLNGVGKTTLIRLISATLGDPARVRRFRQDLLGDGRFSVRLENDDGEIEIELTPEGAGLPVVFLDASHECMHLLNVSEEPNFEDLSEGVEPATFTDEQLGLSRYVLAKDYEVIRVREVEDPTVEEGVLPLFEVQVDGTTYDFSSMGLGELAALMALWHLWRVEPGTVVLLEEPETFLSSRGTVALLDVLADMVNRRRLYAVVTTHSPSVAASVPLSYLRVLSERGGVAGLYQPETRAELEYLLGSHAGLARAVLVEDKVAALVVSDLIGRFKGIWGRSVEVLSTGGADPVLRVCRNFPEAERIRLVGVLDGDQTTPDDTRWPVLTLPGQNAPDMFLRNVVNQDVPGFAAEIGREPGAVSDGMAPLIGADHHDFFPELAKALGLDEPFLVRAALARWLEVDENRESGEEFVGRVTSELRE
jgi:energy-coupling factor transporter ATP-binding protein EcfA2